MTLSGLCILSIFVGFLSAFGLLIIAVSATLLRRDVADPATILSFIFLAATIGLSSSYLAAIITTAGKPHEGVAFFATSEEWFFLAALIIPHLLWLRRSRRPVPAALIATIACIAAMPEFLSISAAA